MVAAQDFILQQDDRKQRWLASVSSLSKAFALCPTNDYADEIRDDGRYVTDLKLLACSLDSR